ncbi:hypothetical protein PLICRDRAFT_32910 [Plicaturopsis crispa FD-325 SS-3]|uniref:Uncharacterized protein n=1 Tax=Plicaturopsis crispa FD-325 SS-3 TaxID=944288 RepID=A0A0C9SQ89_PLICR|nr:hypothetical protein PLICRDRAFT_32910 [Plicaturopsis crispa FD-325 SS-3]
MPNANSVVWWSAGRRFEVLLHGKTLGQGPTRVGLREDRQDIISNFSRIKQPAVLIYDGWSKLQVPITKQDAIVLRSSSKKLAPAKAAPANSKGRRVKDKEPEPDPMDVDNDDADLPMDCAAAGSVCGASTPDAPAPGRRDVQ